MSDFLRWLLTVEIIGVAALPLAMWFFRRLPDRGYAFAKVLGLLLMTYVTWLAGSFFGAGGGVVVPIVAVLGIGAAGWWFAGPRTLRELRKVRTPVLLEEGIFLAAIIIWSIFRATLFHPGISHTEQYMDLNFLTATDRSSSFPPYDPWMSGHTVNYYYFGYLMMALVVRLSGVSLTVGYNLALSLIFAFTLSAAYSIGYALTRRIVWSALAPLFVGLLGNWFAIADALSRHTLSSPDWFWNSTRVVDPQNTINEFPFFSFILGDLHPHVMALPVALTAVAFGCAIASGPSKLTLSGRSDRAWLALGAVVIGSLYTINSWDFPTYLVVVAGCIGLNAYLSDASRYWWRSPILSVVGLAIACVVLFLPFNLHFRSLSHGLGWVTTPTQIGQLIEVFGLFLGIAGLLLVTYRLVFQPAEESADAPGEEQIQHRAEAGAVRTWDPAFLIFALAMLAVLIVGIRTDRLSLLLALLMGGTAAAYLQRVLSTDRPHPADGIALAFIAFGCGLIALTELIYLKDGFDGGADYRMNTVFKLYYQVWVLLGLAGAYGVYRAWGLLRVHFRPLVSRLALAGVALGVLAGGLYTVTAPSHDLYAGTETTLDGAAWLKNAHPGDGAAIQWLNRHGSNSTVELEAVGDDYIPDWARVATFSGLPTVMGWVGHEQQWRPWDGEVNTRYADVKTIYSTSDVATAKRLLRKYSVRYVFVGDTEHTLSGANLGKFARFMQVAFQSGNTIVYTW